MLDNMEILDVPAQPTAAIHLTIPRDEIRHVMGPAISEVYGALAAQGVRPAGPWLSHHFRMLPDVFDFAVSVPVATAVTPVGRVHPSELPACKVARTTYRGPYEGLGDAWGKFRAQIAAQGLESAPGLWEVYAVGPDRSQNPADWETQLNQILVG